MHWEFKSGAPYPERPSVPSSTSVSANELGVIVEGTVIKGRKACELQCRTGAAAYGLNPGGARPSPLEIQDSNDTSSRLEKFGWAIIHSAGMTL